MIRFIHDELGRKMSKSLGNVVDPNEVLNLFPSDSFRISLIANNPFGGDVPFNIANLVAVHNADLADTIGNLVNRCAAICSKFDFFLLLSLLISLSLLSLLLLPLYYY
jgi:methionyl-tRNA synthetase